MKDISGIEKIIAKECMKLYLKANKKKDGRFYKKYRPYILTDFVMECREVRDKYIDGKITENEYKAFCLKYNMRSDENMIYNG